MRRLALLLALAAPSLAAAQWLGAGALTLGEAVDRAQRRAGGTEGLAQEFVLPERPGQNKVAWFDFRWRWIDVPAPGGGKGGLRLYHYASEVEAARRALPAIQGAFLRLVEDFRYVPSQRIPYILYATQREFQATNVFQVTESVLGATSPEDLKMTVPYFGDHGRFLEVSTHELVHQFTIQKLNDLDPKDLATPTVFVLPLWFIEGIAEYYTKGGIDPETDLFLRDLVWNPVGSKGYEILAFGDDRHRGFIPTYKLGQARIAFIAETWGREKIQAFLENAWLVNDGGGNAAGLERAFEALTKRVLGEPIEQVDLKWRAWIKRRYYAAWLATRQEPSQVKEVRGLDTQPEDFVATADGTVILARTLDRNRGRVTLQLFDPRAPGNARQVAADGVPGFDSLHPLEQRTLAITDGLLAFSAQDGPGDRLWARPWRRMEVPKGRPPRLGLARTREVRAEPPGGGRFIQISDPAFSPDGTRIAFVGVAGDGKRDVFVAEVTGGGATRRLTDDQWSERDLAWGREGIYFASDATEHGRTNLFRLDPETGKEVRLTTGPWNDRHPRPLADGSVLFTSEAAGKPDAWSLADGKVTRLTDYATGVRAPTPAAKDRGLLAATFSGGTFRLVEIPKAPPLGYAPVAVAPPAGAPLPIPVAELPAEAHAYDPWRPRNWHPDGLMIFGGASGEAVAGQALMAFSDLFGDRRVFAEVAVLGSWELTQALAFAVNRSGRLAWVTGAFHFVQGQADRYDPLLDYHQREYGAFGTLRWPVDRYRRLEAELTLGALERYCIDEDPFNISSCTGIRDATSVYAGSATWRGLNGGTSAAVSASFRAGYDSLRNDLFTGPVQGTSLLAEAGGQWLHSRQVVTGFLRFDAQHFWQLGGRANVMLRLAGGTSFSPGGEASRWEKQWWVSASDNLRGLYQDEVVGPHYLVANTELQFPLDAVLQLRLFDILEGVVALDFGGVFDHFERVKLPNGSTSPDAWDARTLTGVLGVNAVLWPLVLRVHFGHPWDIGGRETFALASGMRWVPQITLRYFFH